MARQKVLATVLVFLAVESTAVASLGTPLLPTIQRVDGVSLAASQWTLTVTLVVGAVALDGLGVGAAFAVNPLQITGGVPPHETGSAISFYQLARTVAYSVGSALSATLLVLSIPAGRQVPTNAGYSAGALVSTAILFAALAASVLFAVPAGRNEAHGGVPPGRP